jgi:hypothetical protein
MKSLHLVASVFGRFPAPIGAAHVLPVVLTTGGLSHRAVLSPKGAAAARSIAPAGAKQDALYRVADAWPRKSKGGRSNGR